MLRETRWSRRVCGEVGRLGMSVVELFGLSNERWRRAGRRIKMRSKRLDTLKDWKERLDEV
jgi:hypothetical protein